MVLDRLVRSTILIFTLFMFPVLIFDIPNSYSIQIPKWLEKLSIWYENGMISENEFLRALQFLTNNKIIGLTSNNIEDLMKNGISDKIESKITLNPLPNTVNFGQTVTFDGTLKLERGNPEGLIVQIKDHDKINADDLLVTAIVDKNGKFEAQWGAHRTDPNDNSIEIYAIFEGGKNHLVSSTCNSSCDNPKQMTILETGLRSPDPTNSKYLSLHGAFWNKEKISVLITVNPETIEDAKRYLSTVREGTSVWEEMLQEAFPDGNWKIDITVEPEPIRFFDESKYDILTVVTAGSDGSCNHHYIGITDFGIFHTQGYITNMVSISDPCNHNKLLSQDVVKSATSHEFGHVLGLEHAVNIDNDLMCSGTCLKVNPLAMPSQLDIKGIGYIYGEDGFVSPNRISINERGTKFYDNGNDANNDSQIPNEVVSSDLTSDPRYKLYENHDFRFSFEYPGEWMILEDPSDGLGFDSIVVTAPQKSISTYAKAILFFGDLGYEDLEGQDYLDKLMLDHQRFCSDYSLDANGFACDNYVVEFSDFSGEVYLLKTNWTKFTENEETEMVMFLITVPDSGNTLKVLLEGNKQEFEKYHDELQHLVNSFTLF